MTSEHPEISMPQAEPETQEPETPKLDADEPEAEAEPTETEASETEASETEAPDPEAPDPEAPDMEMSDFDNLRLVEALLFASAEPLAPAQIARFLPDDCDRKSTSLNPVTNAHLGCRHLLAKKKQKRK